MNKDLPEKQRSEEVDIIEIFNLIGRAIKSFFEFLFGILELIFKFLIIFALFLKRNLILLGLAALVGLILGLMSDFLQKPFYTSTMLVEPNFETTNQLINNIDLYSQLAKSNDSTALAEIFDISENQASKILDISIKANNTSNNRFLLYEEFTKNTDSVVLKNMNYESFAESLQLSDFQQFYITLDAKDQKLFKKTEKKIINFPVTEYSQKLRETALEIMETKKENFITYLQKIDTLRNDYKKIMLNDEANLTKTPNSGTTFYMGAESVRPTNEIQLFELEQQFYEKIADISFAQISENNYVNMISGFQEIGMKTKKSKLFNFVLGALSIAFLLLLFKEFNKFLTRQEMLLKKND